jgi:hypothetical protein
MISETDSAGNETEFRSAKRSAPFLIAASWIVVLIPLGWGVVQSVAKSLPLFTSP